MTRNLYKVCFEIKSRGSDEKDITIVDKLMEIGSDKIEKDLLSKTSLEEGDIIVNFSEENKIKERWKEIIGLKVIRSDNSIIDLGKLSPISLHIANDFIQNSLFQVFCSKPNIVKVKKAANQLIKEINDNKTINEYAAIS
jgi:hypothetical protein